MCMCMRVCFNIMNSVNTFTMNKIYSADAMSTRLWVKSYWADGINTMEVGFSSM